MPRTRSVVIIPALALAAALTLAACGSSTGTGATVSDTPPTTTAGPTATPPALVAASAVPAVTGVQGAQPTIAKATAPAPTTLLAHDVIVGTGPAATTGDSAMVNYTLALYVGGTVVQSSYGSGGGAFSFTLGQGMVIPGFDAGVVGMQAGGRRELVIPPALGYMDQAQQGIPANSTLIFVVDMVSFTPAG